MNWCYLIVFSSIGIIPALISIKHLLPNALWRTRIAVLISRGLLKIPFGIFIGFLGAMFVTLLPKLLALSSFLLLVPLAFYLMLMWSFLAIYKLMLNKCFKLSVSWKAIFDSLAMEFALFAAFLAITAITLFAFDLLNINQIFD